MSNKINEILASDGEVKAGEGSGKQSTQMSPSPAAAPDVCEWSYAYNGLYARPCNKYHAARSSLTTVCPACGLPIKFKSDGGTMSDLVEQVSRAILGFDHLTDQQWAPHWKAIQRNGITPPKAKRAIKAVAEWVREAGGDDMYARAFSKMIFDELKEGSE